jgi:Aldo/keto reductase family
MLGRAAAVTSGEISKDSRGSFQASQHHRGDTADHMAIERRYPIGRRSFLMAAGSLAATPLLSGTATRAFAQTPGSSGAGAAEAIGRRMLGSLEVSSIGLGVQNTSRKYDTTVPYRPDMINLIRAAFDRGVTFFDAAEAYGPFEVERILGEAVAPFRNEVVITSKFGWNIDPETGGPRQGLNSEPDHIPVAVEGMLRRLRTDRIDLLYQHRGVISLGKRACSEVSSRR